MFLQFAAGFGRGGTSLPFWENVYGFSMSCVGKELVEDAAEVPIVDVIDSRDIVTDTAALQVSLSLFFHRETYLGIYCSLKGNKGGCCV